MFLSTDITTTLYILSAIVTVAALVISYFYLHTTPAPTPPMDNKLREFTLAGAFAYLTH